MIRVGGVFLFGLLLIGCDAHRITTNNVSDIDVSNIKPVKSVASDTPKDIERLKQDIDVSNIKPVKSVASDTPKDIERLKQCWRELEALKRIDIRRYNQRKAEFNKVMLGADIYSGVRSDVRASTQDAVDAYYQYRVNKTCADISKDVLDGLFDK
ncbi:TPA: hypothetical protein OUJ00_004614 [Escherichia coli]|nr:hypothetical protein [Escherichia coli]